MACRYNTRSYGLETPSRPTARGIPAAATRDVPHPGRARGRGAARLRDHEERGAGAGDALWVAQAAARGGPRGGRWGVGGPRARRRGTPLLSPDAAPPIGGAGASATGRCALVL